MKKLRVRNVRVRIQTQVRLGSYRSALEVFVGSEEEAIDPIDL